MVIFKASFDKANRTSHESYRGPGLDEGLEILRFIKERTGLPTLTDVHSVDQVRPVSQAVDVIQTPAFLCRQTDLINAVAASGRPANIKKGQFLSPDEMGSVIAKARSFVPLLARAAIAAGVAGVFMEVHPDPDNAMSDGPNSWPLDRLSELLQTLISIDDAVKGGSGSLLSGHV